MARWVDRALDVGIALLIGGPGRALLTGAVALALIWWLAGWPALAAVVSSLLVAAVVDMRRWPRIWRW